MRQFNTKSKLAIFAFILIFLATMEHYSHDNQNLPKEVLQNDHDHDRVENNQLNPYKHLHIIPNPDGSITRLMEYYPTIPPNDNFNSATPSLSKDVILDVEKNAWVRIFLPKKAISESPKKQLPIVLFVHGGGFILYSAASPVFHNFCAELASQLGALVVSVEYRLAPENRLPAAYDDVYDALLWVKEGKDEWVKEYGNFSRCVLVGQSAGSNILYNVMLRASDLVNDLKPLTIVGAILVQPAIGGLNRTGSELRLANDPITPQVVGDLMWELALPVGADRGHEFCDPTIGGGSEKLGRVAKLGWRVAVVGCDGDPLIDREVEMVEMLKRKGVVVESLFSEGGYHGVFTSDPSRMSELYAYMQTIFKKF